MHIYTYIYIYIYIYICIFLFQQDQITRGEASAGARSETDHIEKAPEPHNKRTHQDIDIQKENKQNMMEGGGSMSLFTNFPFIRFINFLINGGRGE